MHNILGSFMSLILSSIPVMHIYLVVRISGLGFYKSLTYSGHHGRRWRSGCQRWFPQQYAICSISPSYTFTALGLTALSSIYLAIQASIVQSYSGPLSVRPRSCHGVVPVLPCELIARISMDIRHVYFGKQMQAARCEHSDRLAITGIRFHSQSRSP